MRRKGSGAIRRTSTGLGESIRSRQGCSTEITGETLVAGHGTRSNCKRLDSVILRRGSTIGWANLNSSVQRSSIGTWGMTVIRGYELIARANTMSSSWGYLTKGTWFSQIS